MDINGKTHATQNGKTKRSHDRVSDRPKDKAPKGAAGAAARQASVTYGELSQLLDALHAAGRGDFSVPDRALPLPDAAAASAASSPADREAPR